MYTQKHVEKVLALHTRLVHSGLDPDYAELRALRVLDRVEDASVEEVAQEIIDGAEARWKDQPDRSGGKGNFYDELRRRIEAERAAKAQRRKSAKERLDRLCGGER